MFPSKPTLQMVIAKPGEVDLAGLSGTMAETENDAPPQKRSMAELRTHLGFHVLEPKLPGVRLLESGQLGDRAEYCADFGPGATSLWGYPSRKKTIHLEQRRILRARGPKYFVYADGIEAYQALVAGGQATIVLPRDGSTLCFAIWARDDTVVDATFSWPVKGPLVEGMLASLS